MLEAKPPQSISKELATIKVKCSKVDGLKVFNVPLKVNGYECLNNKVDSILSVCMSALSSCDRHCSSMEVVELLGMARQLLIKEEAIFLDEVVKPTL